MYIRIELFMGTAQLLEAELVNSTSLLTFDPSYVGVFVQIILIGLLGIWMYASPRSGFILLFKGAVESIHNFLEEIVGKNEKRRIISLLTSLFFVVLIANMMGLLGDIIGQAIVNINSGEPVFDNIFKSFSSDKNATTALAIVLVFLSLVIQSVHLGPIKFFTEYIPITGKGYISIERENKSARLYYPMWTVVKLFDIIISLFIGVLDIIGVFAKILSVSFRLFGNMFSGTILLGLLTAATVGLSQMIASVDFPIIVPIILWLQGILVALVQAFVVTLLAAIFIKVAKA